MHTADAQSGLDIKFITSPRDLARGERRKARIGFVKRQWKGNDSIDLPRSSRETRLPINNRLLPRRPTREIGRSSVGFYGPRLDREPDRKTPDHAGTRRDKTRARGIDFAFVRRLINRITAHPAKLPGCPVPNSDGNFSFCSFLLFRANPAANNNKSRKGRRKRRKKTRPTNF